MRVRILSSAISQLSSGFFQDYFSASSEDRDDRRILGGGGGIIGILRDCISHS